MLSSDQVVLRLVLSSALSGIIGLERGRLERAAGLRTHALVGLSACLLMLVSEFGFASVTGQPGVALDPSRVAAQVVSGIGFLGAGTIILRREIIKGLTTAASIWSVAAIGLAVGGGLFLAASVSTALGLLILAGLKPLEELLYQHRRPRYMVLIVERRQFSLYETEKAIEHEGLHLQQLHIQPGFESEHDRVSLEFNGESLAVANLVDHLRKLPGVISIETNTKAARKVLEPTEEQDSDEAS